MKGALAKQVEGTCEDHRLMDAGYHICGSNADREWHWRRPNGRWHDGYRSEYAAVNAALRDLREQMSSMRNALERQG